MPAANPMGRSDKIEEMSQLLAISALILLVVVHEMGHFLAARAVGIRATKFYVFFPPAVFKRKVGDVEYGIGAIPAGGFVKLPGMFEPQPGEVAERVRYELGDVQSLVDGDQQLQFDASRRAIAHAQDADDLVAPLAELRDGLGAAGLDRDDPEERAALERARDRVGALHDDVHPLAYWRAPLWRRMAVIFAGPFVNLVVAFVVLSAFWWMLSPVYEISSPLGVDAVTANSPAEEAGLTERSEIVRWDGDIVGTAPSDLSDRIEDAAGTPMTLTWLDADGDRHTARLVPRVLDGEDEPRIGLAPAWNTVDVDVVGRRTTSLGTGMEVALAEMREITWGNLSRLPRVFFDDEIREQVGSVVGIVDVADEVDRAGQFVRYVAVISLVLAVMNLLPLLPLDGGHLLFGILEAARRKPMPRAAFERYSVLGMALVLILFMIGLDNDITRATG